MASSPGVRGFPDGVTLGLRLHRHGAYTQRSRCVPILPFYKDPRGFPGGLVVKNPPANAGDAGPTPGSGRSPGEGNGNPLQRSCLENSMGREAWWATVRGIAKESDTTWQQRTVTQHTGRSGADGAPRLQWDLVLLTTNHGCVDPASR